MDSQRSLPDTHLLKDSSLFLESTEQHSCGRGLRGGWTRLGRIFRGCVERATNVRRLLYEEPEGTTLHWTCARLGIGHLSWKSRGRKQSNVGIDTGRKSSQMWLHLQSLCQGQEVPMLSSTPLRWALGFLGFLDSLTTGLWGACVFALTREVWKRKTNYTAVL